MAANRILVVDDDKAISDGIALNLQYSGYESMVFADGQEVATYLESDRAFDLALLDIMLPGIDGCRLMEYMKRYHIPVIYITAKTDVSSEIQGLRDGAEDYIVKPFEMLSLLVRVEKVLERSGKLNRTLYVGDIVIDTDNRTVTKAGQAVSLKPLEFDVLALLAKYKNRSVSRDRLLDEVWGTDFFGGTRTVDVHIAQIRRKLGLADKIKTLPKLGYRLED